MDPVFARLYDFKDFFQPARSSRVHLQGTARLETTIVDLEKNRREKVDLYFRSNGQFIKTLNS